MPRQRLGPPADARALAHEVLLRVETGDAFADVLLADRLAETALGDADVALATRLVYGTLAWQGRLDHHLQQLVHAGRGTLEPAVRIALRLGLYQLLFLDRVPAYAAVDASVGLARRASPAAAGLVNAVLRRAARSPGDLTLPDGRRDPLGRLAVEWSHPRWLVERWAAELGTEELPALLAANNTRGPTAVRAHRLRTTRDALRAELATGGVDAVAGRFGTDALLVERGAARIRRLPAFREGRLAFQGEASQLVGAFVAVTPGARALDVCAAPGGKATHLAALVAPGGTVVALDLRPAGAARVAAEAQRLGVTVSALAADARRLPLRGSFDAVLVDAPCSGLGTLRRHPELRWRRRADDLERLAGLQRAILEEAATFVRPGGVLVFAVCTMVRAENEDVVRAFSTVAPRFVLEPAPAPAETVTPDGFLRTLPHRHGLDGFFAARWRARP